MLTSKSNFNTFRELKGKQVTDEMLKQLYDNCTSKDFINLNGNISKGYPAEIANFIMQKIDVTKADKIKILVLNDLSFHMYNCLTNAGILPKNITLAFGKWNKDGTPLSDKKVYNIMSMFAKSNFVEFEHDARNIVTLEEIMNMKNNVKFDYIISNPPYAIGNTITKSIIDNVNFDNFINLMPLSCYKSKELYKNVKSLEVVDPKAFEDAAITDNLCICELIKDEIENQTYEDLALKTYKEELREYYKLNISRINEFNKFKLTNKADIINNLIPELDFIVPQKVSNDGVHKTEKCIDYKWNFLYDKNSLINNNGTLSNIWYNPNYHNAKIAKNLRTFWYENSELMNTLLFGLNDQYGHINKAIPNIDYSVDRDYEHLTLDDIMKILKEENPDAN